VSVPPCAIVSAAGLGSRLGLALPKCLVVIGGVTIIERQLAMLADVPEVRVVVGYQKHSVIEHVMAVRPDAVIVDNAEYSTTGNGVSLHLATQDLTGPFLSVDGDVMLHLGALDGFLDSIEMGQSLIGVCTTRTVDAVCVDFDPQSGSVSQFKTPHRSDYEWTGIAYLDGISIPGDKGLYTYDVLQHHVPLRGYEIDCYEVDTPEDLALARTEFR